MIVAGGWSKRILSTVELLGDTTCSLPKLTYGISDAPQMFLHVNKDGNKEVVICGGYPKKTSCLKLVNGAWNHFPELNKKRILGHVAVSMEDKSFIFGGNDNRKSSEVIERGSGSWKEGPLIPGNGIDDSCGVAISKDEILLIGGYKTENQIITYNMTSNTWKNETSKEISTETSNETSSETSNETFLETDRKHHKCAFFKNQLFITGGYKGLKSVDILTLDPFNISKGAELNVGRYKHGLGLIHHKGKLTLAAFGGIDSKWKDLDSVEVFNEDTKTWQLSTTLRLSEKKYNFGFLSVPSHLICPHLYS